MSTSTRRVFRTWPTPSSTRKPPRSDRSPSRSSSRFAPWADRVPDAIVFETQRHLKWRALDRLEHVLMAACGICLFGFTLAEFADVLFCIVHQPPPAAHRV